MTNDDNNNPPGSSLFAALNAKSAAGDAAAPATETSTETSEEPELDTPIAFSTEGLPAHLEIVKAPQPGWDPESGTPPAAPEPVVLPDFELGVHETLIPLPTLHHLRAAALRVLGQSRREILLVTPDLEAARFDNEDFVEALSVFARSSRHAVTRILVGDPAEAVREGHKLVALLRRLSSRIEIRQLHEDVFDRDVAWMLADHTAVLRCTDRSPWQGGLTPKDPARGRRYREQFQLWWQHAELIPDFRDLKI